METSTEAKPKAKTSNSDALLLSKMDNLSRRQWEYLEEKYISRTQKCVPDKFQEMCHMHLSFLLDLSGDKLELLLSAGEELSGKRRLGGLGTAVNVFKKKDKTPTGLFGAPITDEGVCLMLPLIRFLKTEKNICREGLFRKPGNRARMNALREALNVHGTAARLDPDVYTPYDVAGVLKEFLRELPEPLLTDRHMEAHRQVQDMGKHASSEEDQERYRKKKLSALQLLMLLLPSPARKMAMQMLWLLQRVGDCAETKMTPTTLGTIFAPIFFLNRKVDASNMCSAVSQAEPTLAFMISKAHQLFKAPIKLVYDLADYWNCLETGSPLTSEMTSNPGHIKKSISGRTLNTNICFLDREASCSQDVASNTQAELDSLFAHVQSLPDTPRNLKVKKQILKATTTPTASNRKHVRSKSIGASIKKRLPSLGRSRNKRDISSFSASSVSSFSSSGSSTGSKKATPSLTDLLMSPAITQTGKPTVNIQGTRPGLKRHHSADVCSDHTPTKQVYRAPEPLCCDTRAACPLAGSQPCSTPCSTSVVCNPVESSVKDSSPVSTDPLLMTPSSNTGVSISANIATFGSPAVSTFSADVCTGELLPASTSQNARCDYDKDANLSKLQPTCSPDENKDPDACKNYKHLTPSSTENIKARPATPLSLMQQVQRPLTPNKSIQKENEISYMVNPHASKSPEQWSHQRAKPGPKRLARPGTPVMARSVLRLAQCEVLETSI